MPARYKSFLTAISGMALLLMVSLALSSCSRQKNTVVSRTYHKITGRDNYFFNGRERVKTGAKTLAQSHIDRYDRLLKVFRYGDDQQAKAVFPDMDEAIKKASIVIQRHSMVFGGQEKNPWVRESYLLIGKAHFYKHDYWAAIEAFQFVASSYNKELIRFDALLWLTQCYLQLGKTPDAEYLLDFLKNDKAFPWKKKRGEYYAISADFYIQKENYEKAAEDLKNAIASTKKKQDRIRYQFILGQLYQKTGRYQDAYQVYERVVKSNAAYEMEFNARINRARCFDIANGSREIKEQLIKMIRDDKNLDYLDQIYYALASIAEKEGNETEAISLLKQSVSASTINTNQKALSYLELAEIYFRKPDYREAQVYYDSTVTFLSSDHPDYDLCFNKKNSLTKLVKNLNIIQAEDSLQSLARMTPAEREAAVEVLIAAENAEREKQKQLRDSLKSKEKDLEELSPTDQGFNPTANPRNTGFTPTGGGWYFYNPSAVSFGLNEFIKKWGNRKLEDNWRRSSKELGITFENEEEKKTDAGSDDELLAAERDSIAKLDSDQRKAAYLASIPAKPEQIKASEDRIIEAYYNAGLIYKEQLQNHKEAVDDFETMLKRYPDNKFLLPVYYNLYRSYLVLKDTARADHYKNLLLNDHPDSEYAKLITNPNYYQENLKKTAILQVFYENTFRAFKNGQYNDVIMRKANADSLFPPNALTPKFAFLEALAIGKLRPRPDFESSLKKIIARYPKDSVSIRAQEILDLINRQSVSEATGDTLVKEPEQTVAPAEKPAAAGVAYAFRPDTIQYLVVVFPVGTADANDLKVRIADFNEQYFSISELQVSGALLGSSHEFIMVRSFANAAAGKTYFNALKNDDDVFADYDLSTFNMFLITPDNMILLAQEKDAHRYQAFFNSKYLKQ